MGRTSKTTTATVVTTEQVICRKCGVNITDENKGSVSREGKITCTDCLGKSVVNTGTSLLDAQAALAASLERNTKPVTVEIPAEQVDAPAPTVGMVPLSEQVTEKEEKAAKKSKPVTPQVPALPGSTPLGISAKPVQTTKFTEDKKLWAKEFVITTVMEALKAQGIASDGEMAVLKQLEKLNPPVMSDEKKAEQLETLKRARAIWAQQTAERKAAAAAAKKSTAKK